ncbi:MAG: ABC transporter permease [Propionibacteriaceae bacterium]|nr:ABC transporter permease [Propionibacteriaceae bacterium]
MNLLWTWLGDPANWQGYDGIPARIVEHLAYSAVTLLLAALVGIPLGLWIGHTGRGRVVLVNAVNGMRSVPTLGLLFVAVLVVGPMLAGDIAFLVPSIFVLVVLAIPPIMAGAYAGVGGVDPGARDAARGMGMRPAQVLFRVELPCALPLVFGGLRSAALQVVATATLAASVSLGGLGRFLIDGQAYRDYGQMAGGALLVAALAMAVDLAFAGVQKVAVSPGLGAPRTTRRTSGRGSAARSGVLAS